MQDPRKNVMPNFGSNAFQAARDAIAAATDRTDEEAADLLREGWETDNQAKIELWDALQAHQQQHGGPQGQGNNPGPGEEQNPGPEGAPQQIPGGEQQDPQEQAPDPQLQQQQQQQQQQHLNEPANRKRKNKLRDFEDNSVVRTTPATGRPSKYALKKLADYDYVELYYFTVDACKDAAEYERTMAEDAFTLSKIDDTMALKPLNSYKASTKAVPDARLSWQEVSIAKTKLLQCMQEAEWPAKHVMALAGFYVNLDSHEIREEEGGEQVLVQYQAEVRREWMDALIGNGTQKPFDISIVNEERIRRIAAKLLQQ